MEMSDSLMVIIAIALMAGLSIAGIGYAFLAPTINNRDRTNKRIKAVTRTARAAHSVSEEMDGKLKDRRKAVQEKLKELENSQKKAKKKISLRSRIERAGLTITPSNFYILSGVSGVVFAVLLWSMGQGYLFAVAGLFVGSLGFPRWVLGFLAARRQKAFSREFANAIDVIVRGVKSGLPINECLQIIANESPDPVGGEFRDIVESQRVGVSMDQALLRMLERMPLAEVNFFTIVLTIQAKSGGNLSEALGNLSIVLRARKLMRAKIKSMSAEATASAAIIGSLPPGVMLIVYMSTPDYIMTLFTEPAGNAMLVASGIWMLIGVLVMKKMISFKF